MGFDCVDLGFPMACVDPLVNEILAIVVVIPITALDPDLLLGGMRIDRMIDDRVQTITTGEHIEIVCMQSFECIVAAKANQTV